MEMLYQPGNAPDGISECFNFQNVPGEDSPDSPTRALNLTSAAFERGNPYTYYVGKTCLFACFSPNQVKLKSNQVKLKSILSEKDREVQ